MADDPDFIIKLLQKLREDIREDILDVRADIRETNARIDVTNARLEALTELTMARFTTVEGALLDISARTHVLSGQVGKLEKPPRKPD